MTDLSTELARAREGSRYLAYTLTALSITMQAAALDADQRGPQAGIEWISNALVEAGLYPVKADDRYSDDLGGVNPLVLDGETAQQFFDRQMEQARADRGLSRD